MNSEGSVQPGTEVLVVCVGLVCMCVGMVSVWPLLLHHHFRSLLPLVTGVALKNRANALIITRHDPFVSAGIYIALFSLNLI